jgi:hypothetical protein
MTPPLIFGIVTALLATTVPNSSSPWSPAEWRIQMNIGREPGTYMPEEWGASGARLPLNIELLMESDDVDAQNVRDNEYDGTSSVLSVLQDPTFVSLQGQQTVSMEPSGAWKLSTRRTGNAGDAEQIRFWVQLGESESEQSSGDSNNSNSVNNNIAAQRNDVFVLEGDKLFCFANCWRASELLAGQRRMEPLLRDYEIAQNMVDRQLSHDGGDRRLDGVDLVQTAKASVDMALLVKKREDLRIAVNDAKRRLPHTTSSSSADGTTSIASLSKPGHWPGSTEPLTIAKGKVAVKRTTRSKIGLGAAFGGGSKEFHIVGTWTATPLEMGEDAEYYYEDEEEDADKVQESATTTAESSSL